VRVSTQATPPSSLPKAATATAAATDMDAQVRAARVCWEMDPASYPRSSSHRAVPGRAQQLQARLENLRRE
jgi:hypothetical protein